MVEGINWSLGKKIPIQATPNFVQEDTALHTLVSMML